MRKVTITKEKLLTVLRENVVKHQAEYLESVEGFKKKATQHAEEIIKKLSNYKDGDDSFSLHVSLTFPKSYKAEYEQVIKMFEWDETNQVELTQDEFNRYVLDDWDWKDSFSSTTKLYNSR